jgi:hypothetical protein
MTTPIRRSLLAALTLVATASTAALALTPDQIAARFQAEGYRYIEIKQGLTQTKVEAIRGNEKREVVFDRATGHVLKSETETAKSKDQGRNGLVVMERSRDFLRVAATSSGDVRVDDKGRDRDDDDHDDCDD